MINGEQALTVLNDWNGHFRAISGGCKEGSRLLLVELSGTVHAQLETYSM